MKFRVSLNATEATTADGQPLPRGEEINLTKEQQEDAFNARLIADGQLISISQPKAAQDQADKNKEGGSQ